MKKTIAGVAMLACAGGAFAHQPGGPNCGWGNMLFSGQKGLVSHTLASLTNGTSGNATFGMTSGTNGCSVDYRLTYGGKSWLNISAVMDEFAEDVALGGGDAVDALAVSIGIEQADRAHFVARLHENFEVLFPSADVTAESVVAGIVEIMQSDERLARYVA